MQEGSIQKTGGGQLFVYIPRIVQRHFGLKEGQRVLIDWDESDPEDPKLIIYLRRVVEHAHGRNKKEAAAKEG